MTKMQTMHLQYEARVSTMILLKLVQSFAELLISRSYTVLPLPLPLRLSQDFLGAYL